MRRAPVDEALRTGAPYRERGEDGNVELCDSSCRRERAGGTRGYARVKTPFRAPGR